MEAELYVLIKGEVKKQLGIDFNYYEDKQMNRRFDSWLAHSNQSGWSNYFARLISDADELLRFRK
jgi:chemotaxis methyl-accepting protein methylase